MENLTNVSSTSTTQHCNLENISSAFIQFDMEGYAPTNENELIDAILYQNGLVCPSDLRHILGFSKKSLARYINSRVKQNCLIKYSDNTVDKIIYGFDITKGPFKSFAQGYKSNIRYTNSPLSARSVGHAYYATLNNLQLCLYASHIDDITTRSFYEVLYADDNYYPTGAYTSGDTVFDLVSFVYKPECLRKVLLFEQDMGNESISTLYNKLLAYSRHNTFAIDDYSPSIIFSFHKSHKQSSEYEYDKHYQYKNSLRKHWSLAESLLQNYSSALDYALSGIECWTVPTMYLSDYLPYILWDHDPLAVQQLRSLYEDILMADLEPSTSDFYKCRHLYKTCRGFTVAFEYVDADLFSLIRVINYYMNDELRKKYPIVIVLLFDSINNFNKLIQLIKKISPDTMPFCSFERSIYFASKENPDSIYYLTDNGEFKKLYPHQSQEEYSEQEYKYTQEDFAEIFNVSVNNISKHIKRHSEEFDFSAHYEKRINPDTKRPRIYYDQDTYNYLADLISVPSNDEANEDHILPESSIPIYDKSKDYDELQKKYYAQVADFEKLQSEIERTRNYALRTKERYITITASYNTLKNDYDSVFTEKEELSSMCSQLKTQLADKAKNSNKLQLAVANIELLQEKNKQQHELILELEKLINLFSSMYLFDYAPITTNYRRFRKQGFSIRLIPFYFLRWLCCLHNPNLKSTNELMDYYGSYLYNHQSHNPFKWRMKK